jgi:hypothetical protein
MALTTVMTFTTTGTRDAWIATVAGGGGNENVQKVGHYQISPGVASVAAAAKLGGFLEIWYNRQKHDMFISCVDPNGAAITTPVKTTAGGLQAWRETSITAGGTGLAASAWSNQQPIVHIGNILTNPLDNTVSASGGAFDVWYAPSAHTLYVDIYDAQLGGYGRSTQV